MIPVASHKNPPPERALSESRKHLEPAESRVLGPTPRRGGRRRGPTAGTGGHQGPEQTGEDTRAHPGSPARSPSQNTRQAELLIPPPLHTHPATPRVCGPGSGTCSYRRVPAAPSSLRSPSEAQAAHSSAPKPESSPPRRMLTLRVQLFISNPTPNQGGHKQIIKKAASPERPRYPRGPETGPALPAPSGQGGSSAAADSRPLGGTRGVGLVWS